MKKTILTISAICCVCAAHAVTESISWYANNTKQTTTCESGGNITLPTAPAKTGYTFSGWAEAEPYNFSTLDYSIDTSWDATHGRWKPINGSDGYMMQSEFGTENSSDLSNGEWADTFSYGTVRGNAMCSTTSGTYATTGTPANDGGPYCWCMATGYQPTGSDVVYSPNSPLSWVFDFEPGDAFSCARYCAGDCASKVHYHSDFRQALFGVTQ